MNRSLKFRAWDTGKKEIFVPYELSFTKRGITVRGGKEVGTRKTYSLHDKTVLMQFTGLHDKNKRDIYEDDIIDDGDGLLWKVYYASGVAAFRLEGITMPGEFADMSEGNMYEVIGNIRENLELINEKTA